MHLSLVHTQNYRYICEYTVSYRVLSVLLARAREREILTLIDAYLLSAKRVHIKASCVEMCDVVR